MSTNTALNIDSTKSLQQNSQETGLAVIESLTAGLEAIGINGPSQSKQR